MRAALRDMRRAVPHFDRTVHERPEWVRFRLLPQWLHA